MSQQQAIIQWSASLSECREDPRWQRTWLQVRGAGDWRSLAVVPADPSVSSIELVRALVAVGNQLVEGPMVVADLRGIPLRFTEMAKGEIRRRTDAGESVVVAVADLEESPAALPLAKSVDAVVIGVGLRRTGIFKLRQLVKLLGPRRVLGAISLAPRERSTGSIVTAPQPRA